MKKLFFVCTVFCCFFMMSCEEDSFDKGEGKDEIVSEQKRSCNSSDFQNELMKDPVYKANYEKRVAKTAESLKTRTSADCTTPIVLPVAVHFQGISDGDIACLRALAQSQIDILNADFSGQNADISNWGNVSSDYPGVNTANACVQFCLASENHPTGYGVDNGDPAVTLNTTTGDVNAAWSGYINFYVRPNLGFLGYSPLGGSGNGDGVVIDANAFGSGSGCGSINPESPFNLGRTLTHELGHYLLLDHLWADGGCGSSDLVSDTPTQNDSNFGCPGGNTTSCGSIDLHMSYMDYSNDACMYMFSEGQGDRMNSYVESNLQSVINNANSVCGGGSEPTDTDGDGIADEDDNCPTVANTDQADENGNGVGDACEEITDTDGDGVADDEDNCPTIANTDQADANGNGVGDACEEITDTDGDGIADEDDNCPSVPNTDQADANGNGIGDACEEEETTCERVTNLEEVATTENSISVEWNATDGDAFNVAIKEVGTTGWDIKTTSQTNYTFQDLDMDTQYKIRVRAVCGQTKSMWRAITAQTDEAVDENGCDGYGFTLNITLDDYPEETTWTILDKENGNVVFSGGPFDASQAGTTVATDFCLEDGCYVVSVDDAYGDGICCDYGDGKFDLIAEDGEFVYGSDGNFGTNESIFLCVKTDGLIDVGSEKTSKNKNLKKKPNRSTK